MNRRALQLSRSIQHCCMRLYEWGGPAAKGGWHRPCRTKPKDGSSKCGINFAPAPPVVAGHAAADLARSRVAASAAVDREASGCLFRIRPNVISLDNFSALHHLNRCIRLVPSESDSSAFLTIAQPPTLRSARQVAHGLTPLRIMSVLRSPSASRSLGKAGPGPTSVGEATGDRTSGNAPHRLGRFSGFTCRSSAAGRETPSDGPHQQQWASDPLLPPPPPVHRRVQGLNPEANLMRSSLPTETTTNTMHPVCCMTKVEGGAHWGPVHAV